MAYSATAAISSATASDRRRFLRGGVGLVAVLAGLSRTGAGRADDLKKSGTVRIEQVQIAFIGSGNLGGGTLKFRDKSYDFTIGGLGVGGFGVSKITATGAVYNLDDVTQFPGSYAQGRYGFAAGDVSTGKLWLKNKHGVVLALEADRKGLALSLGGDAVYIDFD
jgi:hypothetical protein